MDEITQTATETEELSVGEQTPSQPEPIIDGVVRQEEAAREPKSDGENVEPPAPAQVQPTQERPLQRQPSQYYKERKEIRELKSQISQLTQMVQKFATNTQPSKPAESQEKIDNIFDDPQKYVDRSIGDVKKAIEDFKNEIPTLIQQHEQSKLFMSEIDQAMETMFPKEQDGDNWQAVLERNPERQEKLSQFFKDNPWMAEMAVKYPLQAAKEAVKQLGLSTPETKAKPTSPLVPKKSQMSSTQSSVASGSKGKKITAEDAQTEFSKLAQQLSQDPSNPEILKRFAELEAVLENSLKKD